MQWASDKTIFPADSPTYYNPFSKPQNAIHQLETVPGGQESRNSTASLPSASALNPEPHAAKTQDPLTFTAWMMISWAVTVILLFLWFVRIQVKTRTILSLSKPAEDDVLLQFWGRLTQQAGIKLPVPLLQNGEIPSPLVWGVFHPKVIIPVDFAETLSASQMEWVLLHELGHIRRMDLPVKLLQRVLQIVYFWNPVLWAANWKIDQLREYACDDFALTISSAPREDCGEGLLHIVERAAMAPEQVAQGLGLLDTKSYLVKRLRRILDQKRLVQKSLPLSAAIVLIFAAVLMLPTIRAEQTSSSNEDNKTTVAIKQVPLPNGPALSGTVKDAVSGKGIENVTVLLYESIKNDFNDDDPVKAAFSIETKTDAEGHYVFNTVPQEGRYRIKSNADGYAAFYSFYGKPQGYLIIEKRHQGQIYDISMQPGYYAAITVIDENSQAVEGASVSAIVNSRPEILHAVTGVHGECIFNNLINESFRVRVEKAGFGIYHSKDFKPGTKEQPCRVPIVIKKPGSISGTIAFENGTPAKNLDIRAMYRFTSILINTPEVPDIETKSDENGQYTFPNLGEGRYSILLGKQHSSEPEINSFTKFYDIDLKAGEQKEKVNLLLWPLRKTSEAKGQVVNSDGKPVVGASIEMQSNSQSFAKTDAEGNFHIRNIEEWKEAEFQVRMENYIACKQTLAFDKQPLHFILQPAGRITGHVFDDEGNPISNATVYGEGEDPYTWINTINGGGASTTSGYDGSFNLTSLNEGIFRFIAETNGFEKKIFKNVEIKPGKTITLDFQMSKGISIDGILVNAELKPVAKATIGLLSKVKNIRPNSIGFSSPTFLTDTVQTKGDGKFSVSGISKKGDDLIIQSEGYAPKRFKYDPKKVSSPVSIKLTAGGSITGTIRDMEGKVIPDANIQIFNYPENLFTFQAKSDTEGKYRIDHLPEEEFIVRIYYFPAFDSKKNYSSESAAHYEQQKITIFEGPQTVNFGYGSGPMVKGTLTEYGKPLGGIRIARQKDYQRGSDSPESTVTDAQGHFVFNAIPPGEWCLTYSTKFKNQNPGMVATPWDNVCKVTVPQGVKEYAVDLYANAYQLTVIATDQSSGKAIPNVQIVTQRDMDDELVYPLTISGETNQNGKAVLFPKVPRVYNLFARVDGYTTTPFTVTIPPLVRGTFVSAVTKEIVLPVCRTRIDVSIFFENKPWITKSLMALLTANEKQEPALAAPVAEKVGTYRIQSLPEGPALLSIIDNQPHDKEENFIYASIPQAILVKNDEPLNLIIELHAMKHYQICFKTPDQKYYENKVSFVIPSYPTYTNLLRNVPTKNWGATILIPDGDYPVHAIVPGYKTIEFNPGKLKKGGAEMIYLGLETE